MQGKLYQWCTHLLYCSVLSLSGNVNTRRISKPNIGSIFQIKNQWKILVIGNYYVNYQNLMLLSSTDTKKTRMHLFLFTNSAQRELVSICTQSIRNWEKNMHIWFFVYIFLKTSSSAIKKYVIYFVLFFYNVKIKLQCCKTFPAPDKILLIF